MTYLYSNNAATTLAVAIDNVVTQLTVLDASLFPSSATPTDPFKVTLQDVDTGNIEICDCTDVSGNVLTVIRGRESTASISFPIGALVHHRLTAENLDSFVQDLGNTPTSSTVQITSNSAAATTIAGAVSGTAGVMTGAQVDLLNSKIDPSGVTYENLDANGDVGPNVGQVEPGLDVPAQDGFVLSSTAAGSRSWVAQSGGIGEPVDDAYGYVREGPTNSQWVRGARMFESPTEPPVWAVGDFWIET